MAIVCLLYPALAYLESVALFLEWSLMIVMSGGQCQCGGGPGPVDTQPHHTHPHPASEPRDWGTGGPGAPGPWSWRIVSLRDLISQQPWWASGHQEGEKQSETVPLLSKRSDMSFLIEYIIKIYISLDFHEMSLKRHIKDVHFKNQNTYVICPQCCKQYASQNSLYSHLNRVKFSLTILKVGWLIMLTCSGSRCQEGWHPAAAAGRGDGQGWE